MQHFTVPTSGGSDKESFEDESDYLIYNLNAPCAVCGVSLSTLADPRLNRFHAHSMTSEQFPIDPLFMDACDIQKLHLVYPEIVDDTSFRAFVRGPKNTLILCNVHQGSRQQGLLHLKTQDFAILPFLKDKFQVQFQPSFY